MPDHENVEKIDVHMQHAEEANDIKPTRSIDTVHNDEAVKVLEAYSGDHSWSDEEERKLRRKIDWRLMPILCMTYGLVYYDKAMLSQAVSRALFVREVMFAHPTGVGSVWSHPRPWPRYRRAIFFFCFYILPWVHSWRLSCYRRGSKIPCRTCGMCCHDFMGRLSHPLDCL